MTGVVLDASAVLAVLFGEPGAGEVYPFMADAAISTVNLAEITSKLVERGDDVDAACLKVARLGFDFIAFDQAQAREVAALRNSTKVRGLSLGDCACLALGKRLRRKVLTADRAWGEVNDDIEVQVIR